MLRLEGYEKDGDVYITYKESNNKKELLQMADSLMPLLKNDQLRTESGEPIDWLQIVNMNDGYKVVWGSY